MKNILRFSISGTIGFIITVALFVGMLNLMVQKNMATTSIDSEINFSFVKDFKEPEVEQPIPRTPPVQEKIIQPPAVEKLAVDDSKKSQFDMPITGIQAKNFDLISGLSMSDNSVPGNFIADNPGTLIAAIAPIYPQSPLIGKIEGWVKVQISVNEFGTVSAVTILDAEPARVFNNAAKKAVKKWKFHPKRVDGKAQSFIATQTIEFKLEE